MSVLDENTRQHLTGVMASALGKCKASMDDGPGGKNAELTPEEATMIYRTLVEVVGIRV